MVFFFNLQTKQPTIFAWPTCVSTSLQATCARALSQILLEDCTATPNPNCGCSGGGVHQLFDGYCYGDGSNHLIFVTRIKEVYFGSRQPLRFSVWETCNCFKGSGATHKTD